MNKKMGNISKEPAFKSKFRQHQGWWRAYVLNEKEGKFWNKTTKEYSTACNRINNGEKKPLNNFLSNEIVLEVALAIEKQEKSRSGMIERDRLYNNLLSSQPLAFNFWGFFKSNPELAKSFIRTLKTDLTEVNDIVFEYSPPSTTDHSAFDFAFIIKAGGKTGFIGFECKYTDTFSCKRTDTKFYYGDEKDKNYQNYFAIYSDNRHRFRDEYFSYIRNPNFNQLFRNELLAIQLKHEFDFVITGLFCHHEDQKTIKAGIEFGKKIGNGIDDFILLTYADYFERMQKLDLTWNQRELIMMLWARYCGTKLSREMIKVI